MIHESAEIVYISESEILHFCKSTWKPWEIKISNSETVRTQDVIFVFSKRKLYFIRELFHGGWLPFKMEASFLTLLAARFKTKEQIKIIITMIIKWL